jgi:hypothetical protein
VVISDLDENGFPEVIISGNMNTHIYEYEPPGVEEIAIHTTSQGSYSLQFCPNPFYDKIDIKWQVGTVGCYMEGISLKIYDACGRLIRFFPTNQLTNSLLCQVSWDGRDGSGQCMPPGVYFVRLENEGSSLIKKITKCK